MFTQQAHEFSILDICSSIGFSGMIDVVGYDNDIGVSFVAYDVDALRSQNAFNVLDRPGVKVCPMWFLGAGTHADLDSVWVYGARHLFGCEYRNARQRLNGVFLDVTFIIFFFFDQDTYRAFVRPRNVDTYKTLCE